MNIEFVCEPFIFCILRIFFGAVDFRVPFAAGGAKPPQGVQAVVHLNRFYGGNPTLSAETPISLFIFFHRFRDSFSYFLWRRRFPRAIRRRQHNATQLIHDCRTGQRAGKSLWAGRLSNMWGIVLLFYP